MKVISSVHFVQLKLISDKYQESFTFLVLLLYLTSSIGSTRKTSAAASSGSGVSGVPCVARRSLTTSSKMVRLRVASFWFSSLARTWR